MIQENELRIGNLVNYNNIAFKVTNIGTTFIDLDRDDDFKNNAHIYDIEPIVLTEEILLKCGFVKDKMSYSINIDIFGGGKILKFSGDYLYLIDLERNNTIPTDIVTLWNKDIKKAFYLHELQNLYFALTNEELKIKL